MSNIPPKNYYPHGKAAGQQQEEQEAAQRMLPDARKLAKDKNPALHDNLQRSVEFMKKLETAAHEEGSPLEELNELAKQAEATNKTIQWLTQIQNATVIVELQALMDAAKAKSKLVVAN